MLGGRTTSSAWAGAAASNASAATAQMAAMRAARAIGASVATPARRPQQPGLRGAVGGRRRGNPARPAVAAGGGSAVAESDTISYGFSVKLSGPVTVTWQ